MKIYDLSGEEVKDIPLPNQFKELFHPDLIKRAVLSEQAGNRQPYGSSRKAGKRSSAKLSRRRKDYKAAYGKGISRIPRKTMWRRGLQFGWVAAFAPGTRGGRKAHPPKEEKNWLKKVNKKEMMKAIRSALSATINQNIVKQRNHIISERFPLIIESKLEDINKTKEIFTTLGTLGLKDELTRIKPKIQKPGRSRTTKSRRRKGPLFVVSKKCNLIKAARNIPGIDITEVDKLTTELLAPGAQPGRLTIYSETALERVEREKLYL